MLIVCLCMLATYLPVAAQDAQALSEWKNQKYSMFIHWGAIYSTLGGVWEGKPVTRGYSEQIQSHAGIYSDVYGDVAKRFNPAYWNADSIVSLAKAAGMRSIVITSKHHDGFCMFNSAYTDYNVVAATPFKRDVVKELSDACKRQGLKFGLYFSLIDWHFPEAYPITSSNSDPITPEHHEFNKKQVTELLTNYGPISELWFDMGSQTSQQSWELAELVHHLQPACMVSGRLGNDAGDFCVMGDNNYPDYKIATPWQTPASVYDETWGYRSWQEHGKATDKAREKLEGLIKVASRGGNYLLNIGPRGDGSVVDFEKEVLLLNGSWLKRNGEAIYNTTANPFDTTFAWGEITAKPRKLYLHLLQVPKNREIVLPGLKGEIESVVLLEKRKRLKCKINNTGSDITITLPSGFNLDNDIKVLTVEFKGGYKVVPAHVITTSGTAPIQLDRRNAIKQYSFSGIDYESYYRSTVAASWTFKTAGSVTPSLIFSQGEKDKVIVVTIDGKPRTVKLESELTIPLKNSGATLQWGPMYLAEPLSGGIGGTAGSQQNIDPFQPWPNAENKPWTRQTNWKNNTTYEIEADRNTGWFVLQEITAAEAQPYLIELISGDGIQVFLNGEEQLVHNNPERGATQQEVLLLPLQQGKNQLVVKFYNRFSKKVTLGINTKVPQVLYKQGLPLLADNPDHLHTISIRQSQPVSVHRDMRLPNLGIVIK